MLKFIIYGRKSRDNQNGNVQHTFATSEYLVNNYLKSLDAQGIEYEVVDYYEENFSGGGYYTKRPIFNSIVERCKADKSLTLVCAKADRMTRNMRTGAELMETINFVLANAPDDDDLQKQLEFMIAEREYKNISQRFKDMYQAKKKRCEDKGEVLVWGGNSEKWKASFQANKSNHIKPAFIQKSRDNFSPVVKEVTRIIKYSGGKVTQTNIADHLNSAGLRTPRGVKFTRSSVSRLIKKFDIKYLNKTKYDKLN